MRSLRPLAVFLAFSMMVYALTLQPRSDVSLAKVEKSFGSAVQIPGMTQLAVSLIYEEAAPTGEQTTASCGNDAELERDIKLGAAGTQNKCLNKLVIIKTKTTATVNESIKCGCTQATACTGTKPGTAGKTIILLPDGGTAGPYSNCDPKANLSVIGQAAMQSTEVPGDSALKTGGALTSAPNNLISTNLSRDSNLSSWPFNSTYQGTTGGSAPNVTAGTFVGDELSGSSNVGSGNDLSFEDLEMRFAEASAGGTGVSLTPGGVTGQSGTSQQSSNAFETLIGVMLIGSFMNSYNAPSSANTSPNTSPSAP